jgi:hypothetical protein
MKLRKSPTRLPNSIVLGVLLPTAAKLRPIVLGVLLPTAAKIPNPRNGPENDQLDR